MNYIGKVFFSYQVCFISIEKMYFNSQAYWYISIIPQVLDAEAGMSQVPIGLWLLSDTLSQKFLKTADISTMSCDHFPGQNRQKQRSESKRVESHTTALKFFWLKLYIFSIVAYIK